VPRPKKPRYVSGYPSLTAFVPEGVPVAGRDLAVTPAGVRAEAAVGNLNKSTN
jgi:predicted DNA-binding protein (UPF0251 family)